jgi:hypothetical protein
MGTGHGCAGIYIEFVLRLSEGSLDGLRFRGQAARMFSPGAIISGLTIAGLVSFGPRDEKSCQNRRFLVVVGGAMKNNCSRWVTD